MQFQRRPGTVASTSEVVYPLLALRGLGAFSTSGDKFDTGSHVNVARPERICRGPKRSQVDRVRAVLAFDTDPDIALAHDARAVVVVREVDALTLVERGFEADALLLAAKVCAVVNVLKVAATAALGAIAALLEARAGLRAALVRVDEGREAQAAEAAGRLGVLLIGGGQREREEELVHG